MTVRVDPLTAAVRLDELGLWGGFTDRRRRRFDLRERQGQRPFWPALDMIMLTQSFPRALSAGSWSGRCQTSVHLGHYT